MPVTELGTLGALLASVVDYAGLFPPAGLDMQRSSENYSEYQHHPQSWMLGSFVVPLARLASFGDTLERLQEAGTLSIRQTRRLPVSVILPPIDPRVAEDLANLRERYKGVLVVGSSEVRPMSVEAVQASRQVVGSDLELFYEVELGDSTEKSLLAVAAIGAKAKFRTGGVEAEMIPSQEALASAIEICARLGVPFKATAGLHHPFRSCQPLTYEDDSAQAIMHGFINVLIASTLRFGGMINEEEVAQVLSETDPLAFTMTTTDVGWKDRKFGVEQAARSRRSFFLSFGSCSFVEPVHDLREFGIL